MQKKWKILQRRGHFFDFFKLFITKYSKVKLNVDELSCFVVVGCKSVRAGLSRISFNVARMSSPPAQMEQVKLKISTEQQPFFRGKNDPSGVL